MSHVERIVGDCRSCVFDRLALGNDVLTADQVKPFAFRSMYVPFWYLTYFWCFTFLVKNKLQKFTHWNGLWLIIAFIFFEQLEHRAWGMKVEMEMEAGIIGRAPKPWGLRAWEGGKVEKWESGGL